MRSTRVGALVILALLPVAVHAQIGNVVVTSAASFQPGLPALGSIGTIFCSGLTISGVVSSSQAAPLPYSLAGVTVTIGGAAAPLFAVADLGGYQQINFEVPLDVQFTGGTPAGLGTALIVVSQNGLQGSFPANASTSPGDFFLIGATAFGVFQHWSDSSLVTPQSPAKLGEILIGYATGFPPPNPPVPTGQLTPASPSYPSTLGPLIPIPDSSDTYYINLNNSFFNGPEVNFIGLTPGDAGLYQINFILGPNTRSGNVPITIVREDCGSTAGFPEPCNIENTFADVHYTYGQTVLLPVQ